jgi:hypothetical protein
LRGANFWLAIRKGFFPAGGSVSRVPVQHGEKADFAASRTFGGVCLPPFNFRCLGQDSSEGDFCVFAVEWEANAIRF